MKKIVSLCLLASGLHLFGTEQTFSTITNATPNYIQLNYHGRQRGKAMRFHEISPGEIIKHNFSVATYGNKPFYMHPAGIGGTIRFVSAEENGKEYFIITNYYLEDEDYADFIVLSKEDLQKPEWQIIEDDIDDNEVIHENIKDQIKSIIQGDK